MRGITTTIGILGAVVAGHGSMWFPKPRNQYFHHYCPHCANNKKSVCGGGGTGWGADGDQSVTWVGSYTSPRTYLTAGGTVDVEYYITAAHKGHFVMEICYWDGKATSIQQSCFQRMERDSTDNAFSAYNPNKPWIAYMPHDDCSKQYASAQKTMKTRFKVPNKTADRAILRWYWQTGNSCLNDASVASGKIDSSIASWTLGKCPVASSSGASCGSDCPTPSCNQEQFLNCADVLVTSNGPSNVNKENASIEGSAEVPTTPAPTTTTTTRGQVTKTSATTAATTPAPVTKTSATTAAPNTESPCHNDPVQHCKNSIKGQASYWDETCKFFCEEFARSQERWCQVNGFDNSSEGLLGCVLYGYASACQKA